MTDEDSTENIMLPLNSKPDKPGMQTMKAPPSEPTEQTKKPEPTKPKEPTLSTPPTPESKSAEFWKGYDEGYKEAKAGKKPRAH